ncbi:unnamed protein product [Oppiella nova]|uniref:BTB domain-containing protein n=1 Tax=Oppiella nova TaxID=334625 RepID=A0A7R9QLN5_9ACAR|nr:unnamed protein product [Oppiella nova]CAG2168343.1 unnamed protein product [Oppiella nova]
MSTNRWSEDNCVKRESIDKWMTGSAIDSQLKANIRMFAVFDMNSVTEAVVVTKEDEVFSVKVSAGSVTKLQALSHKGVIEVSVGYEHVCALTTDGHVYAWGGNQYNQLGNGSTTSSTEPMKVSLNEKVVDISCGYRYTLALTDTGHVYGWGYNGHGQVGNGTGSNQSVPIRVNGLLESCRIVSISCGHFHSMAVSDTGAVYSWGYNAHGQLGLGHKTQPTSPVLITHLNHTFICRVCNVGQLGTGNTTNQSTPIQLDKSLGPFRDIAANMKTDISVAITVDGVGYVWGRCQPPNGTVLQPMKTTYDSLHDIFAVFSKPTVTYKSVVLSDVSESKPTILNTNPVMAHLNEAFDDPNTSNFKFIVEGKPIHVHKDILRIRCQHFRSLFANWIEGEKQELELPQYSYDMYKSFLRYLYTGEVCVAPDVGIELLDLAESYSETDLKDKSVRLIRNGITVDNVLRVYTAALKYEVPDLEDLCFSYALAHMTQVTQTKAYMEMDAIICRDFMLKASAKDAFKH